MRSLKISLLAVMVGLVGCSKESDTPQSSSASVKPLYEMSAIEKNVFNFLLNDDLKSFGAGDDSVLIRYLKLTAVSAKQVADDYIKNEVKADSLYKGKELFINAKIDSISSGLNDEPFLTLKGGNMFMSPQAHFKDAKEKISRISELEKGKSVFLVCDGGGEIAGTAMFKGCEFADDIGKVAIENLKQKSGQILQQGYKDDSDKTLIDLILTSIAFAHSLKPDSACATGNSSEQCTKELGSVSGKILKPEMEKTIVDFKQKGILPADFKVKDS